jgi:hypothetical protein
MGIGTTQLALYNGALNKLQERPLASLSEARESRRKLDAIYAQEVAYCLERKLWNFMFRTIQTDNSSTTTPAFGFTFAFVIPPDWVRTVIVSNQPALDPPLNQYKEEGGFWYANFSPLFIKYNSSDPQYGMNLGAWPASFAEYVMSRLARQACRNITGKNELLAGPQGLIAEEERAYKIANANCAMNEAAGYPPECTWVKSRRYGPSQLYGDQPGSSLMS